MAHTCPTRDEPEYGTEEWRQWIIDCVHRERLRHEFEQLAREADDVMVVGD